MVCDKVVCDKVVCVCEQVVCACVGGKVVWLCACVCVCQLYVKGLCV